MHKNLSENFRQCWLHPRRNRRLLMVVLCAAGISFCFYMEVIRPHSRGDAAAAVDMAVLPDAEPVPSAIVGGPSSVNELDAVATPPIDDEAIFPGRGVFE